MDWDKLRIFHAVAEAGSFTHAGKTLNLSQSAISRQISALESSLENALFHRHARGLILTEQGETLYRTTHDVFHKLAMVEAQITEDKERPTGPLKITTTVALGSLWLTPRIKEFIDAYPEVEVHLVLTDGELDLSMREADIGIRLSAPRQPDLIQRALMPVRSHIYASPEYLEEFGTPQTPEDLDKHHLIVYGRDLAPPVPSINWLLDLGLASGQHRNPILTVNNLYGVYRAARGGVGLAGLPDYMIAHDSNLIQVLPDYGGPVLQAYFVYPEELRHSKRIAVFRDFLLSQVSKKPF
ncbi:MAG: LysR family transcriptional regulator [Rhodospirillaceae bacterium]|nr:LysR family transcriptional regulator [Rhodospirillaceae bacterium]